MPRARTVIECRYSTRPLQVAIALAATIYAGTAAAQKPEPIEARAQLVSIHQATLSGEIFIADGYLNKRVMVFDWDTGAFKRGWGAYGSKLEEISNGPRAKYVPGQTPAKQFNLVHCLTLSKDGHVYVCDRTNDRIQVFAKDGRFVTEFVVHPETQGMGSVVSLGLSGDPGQQFLIAADDGNSTVRILRRKDGVEVGNFGHRGHNAGQFEALHQIAVDAHGTVYTGEAGGGMRIQKFVPR